MEIKKLSVYDLDTIFSIPGVRIRAYPDGAFGFNAPNAENAFHIQRGRIYVPEEDQYEIVTLLNASLKFINGDMMIDTFTIAPTIENGVLTNVAITIRGREPRENGLGGSRGVMRMTYKIDLDPYDPASIALDAKFLSLDMIE